MLSWEPTSVCKNGHIAPAALASSSSFCRTCGSELHGACLDCKNPITVEHHVDPTGWVEEYALRPASGAPAYCQRCGKPFPWTETRRETAHRLAMEIEGLSLEDRELLDRSIDDLLADTAKTSAAAVIFKKLLAKAGSETVAFAFKDILLPAVTDAARKIIGW